MLQDLLILLADSRTFQCCPAIWSLNFMQIVLVVPARSSSCVQWHHLESSQHSRASRCCWRHTEAEVRSDAGADSSAALVVQGWMKL